MTLLKDTANKLGVLDDFAQRIDSRWKHQWKIAHKKIALIETKAIVRTDDCQTAS